MKPTILMFLLAASACVSGPRYMAKGVEVYRSDEQLEVTIVRVESNTTPRALIRITGAMSELNDKVLLYEIDDTSPHVHQYVTRFDDEDLVVIEVVRRKTGSPEFRLFLPETPRTIIPLRAEPSAAPASEPILELHERQLADGSVAAVAQFKRRERLANAEKEALERAAVHVGKCGYEPKLIVQLDSASDERLRLLDDREHCVLPFRAMGEVCEHELAQQTFRAELREVVCRFGDKADVSFDAGRLTYSEPPKYPKRGTRSVVEYLLNEARWQNPKPLKQQIELDETRVCHDGKASYVGARDPKGSSALIFFGDGKQFTTMAPGADTSKIGIFFDPREYRPDAPMWQGLDMRYHSRLDTDECTLRCGPREIELQPVEKETAKAMVQSAEFVAPPAQRRPYALARDRKGKYYFVDTGEEKNSKQFRIFAGSKGAMEQLRMVNMVSDSNGQVFSTESGSLRLVIEKKQSFWIEGKKAQQLINLPLEDNLFVIYGQLGVYLGKPLGTPCDLL